MKLILLTSEESFLNNYGAALQGFALKKVLEGMGYDCEIVRYSGGNPNKGRGANIIKKIKRRLNLKKNSSDKVKTKIPGSEQLKAQREKFQEFQDINMKFWNEKRTDWRHIQKKYPKADIYVCGSDQIWNPIYKEGYNDPGYFLKFVPSGKKKIAYAPSFACEDIPQTAQKDLSLLLSDFSAISVREPEGANIIKRYSGFDAKVVADPTFLLSKDEWCKVAKFPRNVEDRYILCYRFMKNDFMTECMNYLSEELQLPIVTLPLSEVSLQDSYKMIFDVGPAEFVGLIRNAVLVCTDSFHATAFSLIMNTPFYTFLDNDCYQRGTTMNSRITNIISRANLYKRVIVSKEEIDIERALDVDFSFFNHNISVFREESLRWLESALTR